MSYTDDQGRPELIPAAWFGRRPATMRPADRPGISDPDRDPSAVHQIPIAPGAARSGPSTDHPAS